MLHYLTDTSLKIGDDDVPLTQSIKQEMLSQLDKKYDNDDVKLLMRKATLLDPRYKGDRLTPDELESVKTSLRAEMVAYWSSKNAPAVAPAPSVSVRVEEEEGEECRQPAKKKAKSLGGLLGRARPVVIRTPEQRAEIEMDTYLGEEVIFVTVATNDRGEEVVVGSDNPLEWWKENEMRFPLMANMARKYLCIPATSTPSERMFSTAGNVVTNLRTLLKPHKVNMLVFLAMNA